MCFGGGGGSSQPSVITMPDTGAYDRQYDRQLEMLKLSASTALTGKQSELDKAVLSQQSMLEELKELREDNAESAASVEAEARRMSNIIGTPPPEVSAKAPVVAEARELPKTQEKKGKRGLRISRNTATSSGPAVGLNIN